MSAKPTLKACHGVGAYPEGLYVVSDAPAQFIKVQFGQVPVCAKCFKAMAEPTLEGKPPKGWTSTSWTVMLQQHPAAPYNFKLYASGHLLPETYKGTLPMTLQTPVTSAQAIEAAEAERDEYDGEA